MLASFQFYVLWEYFFCSNMYVKTSYPSRELSKFLVCLPPLSLFLLMWKAKMLFSSDLPLVHNDNNKIFYIWHNETLLKIEISSFSQSTIYTKLRAAVTSKINKNFVGRANFECLLTKLTLSLLVAKKEVWFWWTSKPRATWILWSHFFDQGFLKV